MSPFEIIKKPIWEHTDRDLEGVLTWGETKEIQRYKFECLQERLNRERGYERDDQTLVDMGR